MHLNIHPGSSVSLVNVTSDVRWARAFATRRTRPVATVGSMESPILLCTDGSAEALRALSSGLDLLGRDHLLVLVTVTDAPDEASLVGSGHAGPELTPHEFDARTRESRESGVAIIAEARATLALGDVDVHMLDGDPGPAICQLATELSAQAIVVGSRGRGGLRRIVLGSVSDYITRNAPCSVVVTRV